jgi:peptide deformylase
MAAVKKTFRSSMVLLGDPRLYQTCSSVTKEDQDQVLSWAYDLDCVMEDIRSKFGFGRAIAAPQIGIMKRMFYVKLPEEDQARIILNPHFSAKSDAKFEVWDDCMSLPNLLVKVERHQSVTMDYVDENFEPQQWTARDDISELLQHEYDHLDGIVCTMRALDEKSLKWKL